MSGKRNADRRSPKKRDKQTSREKIIDEEVEESFPASDPPSYAGGRHSVGAPEHKPGSSKSKD